LGNISLRGVDHERPLFATGIGGLGLLGRRLIKQTIWISDRPPRKAVFLFVQDPRVLTVPINRRNLPLHWWEDRMSMKSPNPVDVHVGRRIKMRRMMLNMLQSDLGETSAGITFQQIQSTRAKKSS
jgi:hypothetical protein